MIHVFEGPNFVGKTVQATLLSRALGVPILEDPVARGSYLGTLSPRDRVVMSLQRDMDVAVVSRHLTAVVDRWVLTPKVYDGRRGETWPIGAFSSVVRAADALVYLLYAPADALLERSRGDRPGLRTEADASLLILDYRLAAGSFSVHGGEVVYVDAARPVEEVHAEILSHARGRRGYGGQGDR